MSKNTAKQLSISFGALSPPLVHQLSEQGVSIPVRKEYRLQKAADHIVTLAIAGYLSESEVNKARKRLMKDICRLAVPKS